MKQPWSDLPNTHHIDWVLNSLKENPELWYEAWDELWNRARDASWDKARTKVLGAARGASLDAVWEAVRRAARAAAIEAARAAARDVLVALIAYDDCDQYLNMGYEKLKIYAILSDKPQAVLLLPMMYVREKLNETALV